MKLQYLHWDNFRFLTGLGKSFASTADEILREFDEGSGGQITKLMRALNSPTEIRIDIPPGNLLIQYDEETNQYGRQFESFLDEKYADALKQGNERYAAGMPWTLTLVIKRGDRRAIIDMPLAAALRTQRDFSTQYQVYAHSYVHDENGENIGDDNAYIGVTKRGWRTRWAEHIRSAERGSRYRFHQAIRHFGDTALTVLHRVIACGQTEAEAMALEEQMVGLETLYPKGLNMIPGGYAGLKYLRQIGAAGANERVTPDDKQEIVNRFFETASRRGLPNPLAAANWCDPAYAEKVICAGDDRLKPDQIRNARFLASIGKSTDDIVTAIGARNKPQVQRLLAGSTYSRVA
jgi:hypothetical protein